MTYKISYISIFKEHIYEKIRRSSRKIQNQYLIYGSQCEISKRYVMIHNIFQ